jgi:hypothetical protein
MKRGDLPENARGYFDLWVQEGIENGWNHTAHRSSLAWLFTAELFCCLVGCDGDSPLTSPAARVNLTRRSRELLGEAP